MSRGIFITLEGPDGAGKTTQIQMMKEYLESLGKTVLLTREPGGTGMERGEVVICDRFVDSSVAYQGYGRGLGDAVQEVNRYATAGLEPDRTFFMDLDPAIGRGRIGKGVQDRMEREKLDFHYRVYEGYLKIWQANPHRVIRLDASRSIDTIQSEIRKHLQQMLDEEEQ